MKKYPEFDFILQRVYEQPYGRYPERYPDRYPEPAVRYESRWGNRETPGPRRPLDAEPNPTRPQKRYDDYGPSMSRRPVHDVPPSYPKKDYERKMEKEYEKRIEDVEMRDDSRERKYEAYRKSKSPPVVANVEDPPYNKPEPDKFLQVQSKPRTNVTLIQDILNPPGRYNRPPRIVIILRGPPGSGKTFLAKLIKDKEVRKLW